MDNCHSALHELANKGVGEGGDVDQKCGWTLFDRRKPRQTGSTSFFSLRIFPVCDVTNGLSEPALSIQNGGQTGEFKWGMFEDEAGKAYFTSGFYKSTQILIL